MGLKGDQKERNMPGHDVPVAAAAAAAAAAGTTAAVTATAAAVPATATAAAAGEDNGDGKKPVLAIDIDEVLGQFVLRLCEFHNESYGTSLTPEDFSSYYFHEVWGGSREASDDKMRAFFESRHFLDGIPVVDGAERVLRKHSAGFELHIVTSRQDVLRGHTERWVEANYPGVFAGLHFGNHFSRDGVQRSKPELCRSIGAALIVDDNMRYATQCAADGIPAYLFGDYAWNRTSEPLPENVRRTVSWAEVDAQLDALLSSSGSSASTSCTIDGNTNRSSNSSSTNSCCSSSNGPRDQRAVAPAVTTVLHGGAEKPASAAATAATTVATAAATSAATAVGSQNDGHVRPGRERKVSQPVVLPSTSTPLGEEVVACSA